MGIFSIFCKKQDFEVYGPQGGIATRLVLPSGFDPGKDKCPMVVLMHGFISRKERQPLPSIAKALADIGVASLSFDFDAHGRSEGKFIDMTISSEIADAKAVVEYANSLEYVSGVSFLGHSQGGVIAGMLAGQLEDTPLRPDSLVLMAPAAVLKDDAINGKCMNARYDASNPPEYVNVLFHKLGKKFITEAQKLPIFETSCKYSGKVCLIHGTKDSIVPFSYSEKYKDGYKNATLHTLVGGNHFFNSNRNGYLEIIKTFIKANVR